MWYHFSTRGANAISTWAGRETSHASASAATAAAAKTSARAGACAPGAGSIATRHFSPPCSVAPRSARRSHTVMTASGAPQQERIHSGSASFRSLRFLEFVQPLSHVRKNTLKVLHLLLQHGRLLLGFNRRSIWRSSIRRSIRGRERHPAKAGPATPSSATTKTAAKTATSAKSPAETLSRYGVHVTGNRIAGAITGRPSCHRTKSHRSATISAWHLTHLPSDFGLRIADCGSGPVASHVRISSGGKLARLKTLDRFTHRALNAGVNLHPGGVERAKRLRPAVAREQRLHTVT